MCLRDLLPTPTWLRLAIVPVLAFLATATDRHYLADFWHHLARGRAIVEQGQIVNRDLFTFTVAGQPFQDVNWLTQIGYFVLYETGGLALVQVVNSLIIALTMLLVVQQCWRRAASLLAGVLAGAVAFFGVWEVLTIRPQTLSMLLFVILLDLLERSQRRPWLLILPPALIVLWANLHVPFRPELFWSAVLRWCRCANGRQKAALGGWIAFGTCRLASTVHFYAWRLACWPAWSIPTGGRSTAMWVARRRLPISGRSRSG